MGALQASHACVCSSSNQKSNKCQPICIDMACSTGFFLQISPRIWSLFPQLHQCCMEFGFSYLENLLVPFDNYISRGTEVFLTSKEPSYIALVMHLRLHVCAPTHAKQRSHLMYAAASHCIGPARNALYRANLDMIPLGEPHGSLKSSTLSNLVLASTPLCCLELTVTTRTSEPGSLAVALRRGRRVVVNGKWQR